MKFLITGSIQSERGPRKILTFTIVLLVFFLFAHSVREIGTTGFFPSDIQASLYAGNETPARSLLMVIEDLHTDLLLISMTILFLGSLLYQCSLAQRTRSIVLNVSFFFAVVYLLSRPAAVYFSFMSWAVMISFVGFHLFMLVLTFLPIRHMYFSVKKEESAEAN